MISVLYMCLLFVGTVTSKNVLILLADDAGLEVPIYGNSVIKTPHLDHLASCSAVFTSSFTSVSSCSPSRSAILTGLPTHQNGMYGLHQGYHHFNSFDKVKSLPNLLRKGGIKTGIIGKKHVGPGSVYKFDYEQTEENHSILQVGRNITKIRELTHEFLENVAANNSFFLYVAFHDPHRCGHTHPEFGQFCEKYGNGKEGMGTIPDWTPVEYDTNNIEIPYFIQNTEVAREDLAAQYTTISRLDQGVGLILKELEYFGKLDDTLIIYSSDNGVPFPNGRTNAYDPGVIEPLFVSSPEHPKSHGVILDNLVTHLDITPTVLSWFNITYPKYYLNSKIKPVTLTGESILPLLENFHSNRSQIFVSHTLHEATMYYPMRAIRTDRYKLIHNINYRMPFPIDQDFYISNSFQDLLKRHVHNISMNWFKTLEDYYFRAEWELYDLKFDPYEVANIVGEDNYWEVFEGLRNELQRWLIETNDPWRCSPHAVLEDSGPFKKKPTCLALFNNIKY